QITLPFYRRNVFKVRVKEGVIKPGMRLKINEKIIEIESIEAERKKLEEAKPGEEVWLITKNGNVEILAMVEGKEVEFF
ncbi:MAG: EF-Tu/IF-2/RF-3 family GTPase, partial [Candidatus Aenigmatarchaeota archaeon]